MANQEEYSDEPFKSCSSLGEVLFKSVYRDELRVVRTFVEVEVVSHRGVKGLESINVCFFDGNSRYLLS